MPSKRVEVTWIGRDKKEYTQEAWLLDDDDPLHLQGEQDPVHIIMNDRVVGRVGDLAKDRVIFEDEGGIFMLEAKLIRNIQILEEPYNAG